MRRGAVGGERSASRTLRAGPGLHPPGGRTAGTLSASLHRSARSGDGGARAAGRPGRVASAATGLGRSRRPGLPPSCCPAAALGRPQQHDAAQPGKTGPGRGMCGTRRCQAVLPQARLLVSHIIALHPYLHPTVSCLPALLFVHFHTQPSLPIHPSIPLCLFHFSCCEPELRTTSMLPY